MAYLRLTMISGRLKYDQKNDEGTEMLLQARWRLGLSQHQVASLAGLADRQYQRYEYGEVEIHRINLRAGLALFAVLEINPVSLVFDGNANALKELRKQTQDLKLQR